MNVLALDPGITTGWAIFISDEVSLTGNLEPDEVEPEIRDLLTRYGIEVVATEKFPLMPHGALHSQLRRVVAGIERASQDVVIWYVTPGVWKTAYLGVIPSHMFGRKLSRHEQDAIGIGRYYIRRAERGQGG